MKNQIILGVAVALFISLSGCAKQIASSSPRACIHTPPLRIALMGNPNTVPEWTDAQIQGLVDAGFNAVQLNVAWGSRPQGEPLNLKDVVWVEGENPAQQVRDWQLKLRARIALAKQHGLRTIFHFGSPCMWWNPDTGEIQPGAHEAFNSNPPWFDSANPKVVEHETGLLKEFIKQFPDVDDILVYTYDQDAWEASQFQQSPYSYGVPLDQRLPTYLKTLHDTWTNGRAGHRMWWEPWELSSGQVYKIIPQLPTTDFGLSIHNNIAEAEIDKPVDLWYRTVAHECMQRGIPVIGEGYFTEQTEEVQSMAIPCPRLVDEEYRAMTAVPGIVGVKEYFGVLPLIPDLNLAMFTARLKDPNAITDELLDRITKRFGKEQPQVKQMSEELSEAMRYFPFEATWFMRLISQSSIDHGWSGATIRGQMADTPDWNSSRHALFMKCDDRQPHPDMLEDVQLRCEISADHMRAAQAILPELISNSTGADQEAFQKLQKDLDHFQRVATSYALHLRETNVAMMLRNDANAGRPLTPRLVDEMKQLLAKDVENQFGKGRVVDMQKAFDADPAKFVQQHLAPTEKTILEKGYFTATTR